MEKWIRLEAVRLWYTYGRRDDAVKLLREGGYGKVTARKWLEKYAHKYSNTAIPITK